MNTKRFNLFGVHISVTNLNKTVHFLVNYDYTRKGYICLPDTYVIALSKENKLLKRILNYSILTLPDGKPIEFYARFKKIKNISTVSGYWLLKELLKQENIKHYFYGSNQHELSKLISGIKNIYPDVSIVGYKSPPMIKINEIENNEEIKKDIYEINKKGPDIIWIGLSSPKQDLLMYYFNKDLERGIMIGVGGVFDYLSGKSKKSPEWIKKIGLRWFYRFVQEPGRLWRKYYFGITRFLMLWTKEIISKLK